MSLRVTKRRALKALVVVLLTAVAVEIGWDWVKDPPANLKRLAPAFATARAEFKDRATQAAAAGKKRDWASAVRALGTIIEQGGYSDTQEQELLFALTEIRRKASRVSPPDTALLYRIDELTLAVTD
jgi:hypothetical protein